VQSLFQPLRQFQWVGQQDGIFCVRVRFSQSSAFAQASSTAPGFVTRRPPGSSAAHCARATADALRSPSRDSPAPIPRVSSPSTVATVLAAKPATPALPRGAKSDRVSAFPEMDSSASVSQ
jgi:hypothetical protein